MCSVRGRPSGSYARLPRVLWLPERLCLVAPMPLSGHLPCSSRTRRPLRSARHPGRSVPLPAEARPGTARSGRRPRSCREGGPAPGSAQSPRLAPDLPAVLRAGRGRSDLLSLCGAHLPVLEGCLPGARRALPCSVPEDLEARRAWSGRQERGPSALSRGRVHSCFLWRGFMENISRELSHHSETRSEEAQAFQESRGA